MCALEDETRNLEELDVPPWPRERFILTFSQAPATRADMGVDALDAHPVLVLVRPGRATVWREFAGPVTVTPDVALEVFEAVYAALESTSEVTLESVG